MLNCKGNIDVFAFPGNFGRSYSEGCNNLIKSNRASLITSIKDLEYAMNWSVRVINEKKNVAFELDSYEPDEQIILKILFENNNQMP